MLFIILILPSVPFTMGFRLKKIVRRLGFCLKKFFRRPKKNDGEYPVHYNQAWFEDWWVLANGILETYREKPYNQIAVRENMDRTQVQVRLMLVKKLGTFVVEQGGDDGHVVANLVANKSDTSSLGTGHMYQFPPKGVWGYIDRHLHPSETWWRFYFREEAQSP